MLSLLAWLFFAVAAAVWVAGSLRLGAKVRPVTGRFVVWVLLITMPVVAYGGLLWLAAVGLSSGLLAAVDFSFVAGSAVVFLGSALVLILWGVGRQLPAGTVAGPWRRSERWWLPLAFVAAMGLHGECLYELAQAGDAATAKLRDQTRADLAARRPAPVVGAVDGAADAVSGYSELRKEMDALEEMNHPTPLDLIMRFNVAIGVERQPVATTRQLKNPAAEEDPNAERWTLAEFLAANAEFRQRLLEITRRPVYRFGPALESSMLDTDVGPVMILQGIATYLNTDARDACEQGDLARAIEDLNAMTAISDHLTVVPESLISALVAFAIRGIEQPPAEDLLSRAALTPALLRSWRLDGSRSCQAALLDAMYVENDFMAHQAQRMQSMSVAQIEAGHTREESDGAGGYMNWLMRAYALPRMAAQMYASTCDLQQFIAQPAAASLAVPKGSGPLDRTMEGVMPRIVRPALVNAFRQAVVVDVQFDLMRLARAATLYKLATGAYPATLEALVPEYIAAVPVDPFDGQPIKMRAADGGLILWSVGIDQQDEQGVRGGQGRGLNVATDAWDDQDITFYVGPAYTADVERFRQAWAAERAEGSSSPTDDDPDTLTPEEAKKFLEKMKSRQ